MMGSKNPEKELKGSTYILSAASTEKAGAALGILIYG